MLLPISSKLQRENLKMSARLFQVGINLDLVIRRQKHL